MGALANDAAERELCQRGAPLPRLRCDDGGGANAKYADGAADCDEDSAGDNDDDADNENGSLMTEAHYDDDAAASDYDGNADDAGQGAWGQAVAAQRAEGQTMPTVIGQKGPTSDWAHRCGQTT